MRSSRSRRAPSTALASVSDGRQLLAEAPALLAQLGRGVVVALPAGRTDPLGERVDLAPEAVAAASELTLATVEIGRPVDVGGVDVPAGQGGFDAGEVVAEAPDVDHAVTVADPRPPPRQAPRSAAKGCSGRPMAPR